jgi:CRP-like cAMP-binding protein
MSGLAGPVDPFWTALGDEHRAALLAAGRARSYPRGGVVFRQGDRSDFIVVILEGRVKIIFGADDGTETILSVRGPGAIVGELGAIDAGARLATVIALESLRTRVLTATEFHDFIATRPGAAPPLLRMLVGRLREADRRRVEFGAYAATQRVAHLLAELAQAQNTNPGESTIIRLSQQELARMVGASRESATRALAELRDRKIIRTGRRAITILQPDALDLTS